MATADTKTVADLMVERLHDWGVDRVYGYPGDGNNPFLLALRRSQAAPAFIQAKHEEAAAFMAVAEAKYGRQVGVVTSTQGPGAVHLLNGLYDAKLDSAAVVALVAQQHTSVLGSDYQQEIDLQTLFHDVASPYIQTVASPDAVPMVLDRAFRSALTYLQPAVVIVPHDLQQAQAPEIGQEHGQIVTAPGWSRGRTLPRERDIEAASEIIEAGDRVAILAGRGMRDAQRELIELAEHLGAGVTMSLLGKPYVDESHSLVAGTMGHLGTTAAARVLQDCDTLIIVGSNDPWTEFYPAPGQARAVQIDIDPSMLGNRYPIEVGIVSDAAAALEALRGRLHARPGSQWRRDVETHVANWHEISRLRAAVEASPLNPELVVRELADRIPPDAQLAIDVGSCVYHYARQVRMATTVEAHLSSTLASMGCGVPYGIGAKEVAPDRPVVVLAGDGAMQMLGNNELVTVASRWPSWPDPRFVVVVLHNRDLAEVSWEQREFEAQPRFEVSQQLPAFDFAGYAELLGLRGIRIDDPSRIPSALDEAFASDRPVVVEAITDRDVPLLPPFPHVDEKLDAIRGALGEEGAAGARARDLLDTYVRIEMEHR
ncbi:thiamine pyrophosphate-requiring protein [Pseudoclavibacter endophyticus]|uniref:Thiamine pyrophosphate-requiring protein n=1 Tax=Pseudoclavibacter endophyticus TaxID=1778590 RepID=A0A6H9WIE8_9MICO|nr:thiamine pyrophosphate-requiring protein [Pseudoclavibacter endophyticus]KAB1648277.1 thiamine pyrophosphate-requiring protein [Pseudoclavibacter endophyticus]GGA71262.1 thiamine pyrophosphate-requiring protein [Pseudoclavibacter endophyticus]